MVNYSPSWASCCHYSRNILFTQSGIPGGMDWKDLPDSDPLGKRRNGVKCLSLNQTWFGGFSWVRKRGSGQWGT